MKTGEKSGVKRGFDSQVSYKEESTSWNFWDRLGKPGVFMALAMVFSFVVLVRTGHIELAGDLWFPEELGYLLWLLGSLGSFSLLIFLWRAYLVLTYRPVACCSKRDLPKVTVVVPAYNEGRLVMETLFSVAASYYPRHKLQIIAVDDGSKDDTWRWMQEAAARLKNRVELVRLPANKGKRRALYEGFQRATGQVLVTIDSDSIIERHTLRQLVAPFAHDGRCGGVAGNVRVLNRKEGLIPRMLEVTFTYSFDFMRASQSRVNAVFCTPGALSAYRRDLVMNVLDQWLGQRFLGEPAGIGEDRAMTNMILKQGYHVLFQRDAVVYTKVPTAYKGLCKMYLRWARSNIRENLAMAAYAFRRFRSTPALGARITLVQALVDMTFGEIAKVLGMVVLLGNLDILLPGFVVALCCSALVPAGFYWLRHKDSDLLWAFTYAPFNALALSWISLYALCTVKRSGWLTRELPAQSAPVSAAQALAQAMAGTKAKVAP